MKNKKTSTFKNIILLLILILILSSCATKGSKNTEKDLDNLDQVLEILRENGADINIKEREKIQPHLNYSKNFITVNEETVQVYECTDSNTAQKELKNIANSAINWNSTPNYFQKDKIFIIYIGKTDSLINLLKLVAGEPQYN
ncbi:MAG: hypothetical protein H7Y18_06300 [Clostridiaceae bacterium]|nr:hypothetical protein [Clostridiaceae bacterium]